MSVLFKICLRLTMICHPYIYEMYIHVIWVAGSVLNIDKVSLGLDQW